MMNVETVQVDQVTYFRTLAEDAIVWLDGEGWYRDRMAPLYDLCPGSVGSFRDFLDTEPALCWPHWAP